MPTTQKELYAIQPGARILITGANGYIGSHVVNLLLSLGYLVRGTVRAEKPWLDQLFASKYGPGKFESVVVPRLDDQEALAKAMGGVSGIVHVVCINHSSIPLLIFPKYFCKYYCQMLAENEEIKNLMFWLITPNIFLNNNI